MGFELTEITNPLLKVLLVNEDSDYIKKNTEYGVRWIVGQESPIGERVTRYNGVMKVGSATGLVANVGIDDQVVENSFDDIPIFANQKRVQIGDNTFVQIPKRYLKTEFKQEGGINYQYEWVCGVKLGGYRLPLPYQNPDGSEKDYIYVGAYEASVIGGVAKSKSGEFPSVNITRNNARIASRKNDGDGTNVNSAYLMTDLQEAVDCYWIPFWVEFATRNSQAIMQGAVTNAYSANESALSALTSSNQIVVSNTSGSNFRLNQTVSIGTSNTDSSIANNRVVTNIEIDTPNVGETTITFDGDPINIAIGNVIATRGWKTGMTDGVVASSGSFRANDGKHPFKWRGIENLWGNVWKFIDGLKISNNVSWIALNPSDYSDTSSVGGNYQEPFIKLNYINALENGYTKEMGFDERYPFARTPKLVGGGSSTYYSDYYYQSSDDRTALLGGYWIVSSVAGVSYWNLNNSLTVADFYIGFRLSYRP